MGSKARSFIFFVLGVVVMGTASFLVTRLFVSPPATPPEALETAPVISGRQTTDNGSIVVTTLYNSVEVYRILAEPIGAPEIVDGIVRIRFTIPGLDENVKYTADIQIPKERFPIEILKANPDGTSDERLVSFTGLLSALSGRKEIELRIVINPQVLATPEEEVQLAALRGVFVGIPFPIDVVFHPVGIAYKENK
jgi:hypothetical protein